jgi:hypothetical protein
LRGTSLFTLFLAYSPQPASQRRGAHTTRILKKIKQKQRTPAWRMCYVLSFVPST